MKPSVLPSAKAPGPDKRSPGRPTAAQRKDIHAAIINAAWEEFVAHGYGAATTQRIAKRANVSITTFYGHFDDKAAVFAETLAETGTALSAQMRRLGPEISLEDGLGQFARAFLAGFTGTHYAEAARLLYAEARRFPELCEVFMARTTPWVGNLGDFLGRFRPDLDSGARRDLAMLFVEMVAGRIHREQMLGISQLLPEQVLPHVDTCVAIFAAGLARPRNAADA